LASSSSPTRALGIALVACAALLGAPARAKVFHSQAAALELAFPEADRIETDTRVLSKEEAEAVERASRSKLDSRIARFYAAWKGDRVIGYAYIDVHTVRTLPEAFMVVLEPDGTTRSVRVLAFHEPLDYLPTERWYEQFERRTLADPLRLGRDIHAIAGATLSARAVTRSVRRVLALFRIVVKGEPPSTRVEEPEGTEAAAGAH
jgi:Na+-translocating ferredoxin:NAD+ oxidoreductase RnfG subunit